jgi:hypothetical protein
MVIASGVKRTVMMDARSWIETKRNSNTRISKTNTSR